MPGRPIALTGFMGAGKSTVGRSFARSSGRGFVDLDEEISAAFAAPIPEVFARWGEPAFRAMERRLLRQALALPERVVALGAGAVLDPANRNLLANAARWVQLDLPLEVAAERVGDGTGRPLWSCGDLRERFDARVEAAQGAHLRLDATAPLESLVDRLARWCGAPQRSARHALPPGVIEVPLAAGAYPVHVVGDLDAGLAACLAAHVRGPVAVITDDRVGPWYADRVAAALPVPPRRFEMPAGEANKRIEVALAAVDVLLRDGWSRDGLVIALGGGVVGDLAGFAAAITLRGVRVLQIPTSLLAMVDSSVGGKVAVNHPAGKNLIGAFHQPVAVWAPLDCLDTLPDRELRAGLAEVVKAAWVGDAGLLDVLEGEAEALLARDRAALQEVVLRCVQVKARIVAADPEERGLRRVLNLGHTFGHALERVCGYGALRHGEAVAIGLVAAAALARRWGLAPASGIERMRALLTRLGLPTAAPPLAGSRLIEAILRDKKLQSDGLPWVYSPEPGHADVIGRPVTEASDWIEALVSEGILPRGGD